MYNKKREYTLRYMNYKKLLTDCFRKKVFDTDNNNIMLSETSLYSSTCKEHADITSAKIANIMNTNNITITDATAHIGGNTNSFAKNFKHVNAIEINKSNFDMLMNNMKILERGNITFQCDDYLRVCKSLKQDVVFIDPPWGGPEYKNKDVLDISLSKVDLGDIIIDIIPNTKLIVLKLPFNYNFNKLMKKLQNKVHTVIIDQLKKHAHPVMMTYIIV